MVTHSGAVADVPVMHESAPKLPAFQLICRLQQKRNFSMLQKASGPKE